MNTSELVVDEDDYRKDIVAMWTKIPVTKIDRRLNQ